VKTHIDIVFDGPPGPEGPRLVEVEDEHRKSIKVGEWLQRPGGYWVIYSGDLTENARRR
jgi:hypothetical protein